MADKGKLAGSAASSAAQKRGKRGKKKGITRNVVTEWIGQIETTLASEHCAASDAPETHEAKDSSQADRYGRGQSCHASIYYVRGHRASSIEIVWWGLDPARTRQPGTAVRQPERFRPRLLHGEL